MRWETKNQTLDKNKHYVIHALLIPVLLIFVPNDPLGVLYKTSPKGFRREFIQLIPKFFDVLMLNFTWFNLKRPYLLEYKELRNP